MKPLELIHVRPGIMTINYGSPSSEDDFRQILSLQQANHASTVSDAAAARDGFVTVVHTLDMLKRMNDAAPQVIAKDGDMVIGYALVMLKSFQAMIPVLVPMFEKLSKINYDNKKITDHSFYVMGQICIAAAYRGQGVFDALYRKHKEMHQAAYDLCITSVSTRNGRSMRAHERVGFDVVHTFRDQTDEWKILTWDLRRNTR